MKIQADINSLKVNANDQAEQEKEKEKTIKEFQVKLDQIRNAAYFLDDMT